MKRPPPVIPSKLPRTRTWEITPAELAKPTVPASPPGAAADQTIARDPEDAAQSPDVEEGSRKSSRAGPPEADSAAVQRLSAPARPPSRTGGEAPVTTRAAKPSPTVQRDLEDVRQGLDDRPAEPGRASAIEEVTGVGAQPSHPAPAVDRKVEAKSPSPAEVSAPKAPVTRERAQTRPTVQAKPSHAGEAETVMPDGKSIGEDKPSLESAPPLPLETVSPQGEAPVEMAAVAPAEIQAKRARPRTGRPSRSAAPSEIQAVPAEAESSPVGTPAESPPAAPSELEETRPSQAAADGSSVSLPAGGPAAAPPAVQTERMGPDTAQSSREESGHAQAAAPPSIQTMRASPDAPRGFWDTEVGSSVEAPAEERALTPPDIQAIRAEPETTRPSRAVAKSQAPKAPAGEPPAALPEVQAKAVSGPDRVEPDTIAAPVDRQSQAGETAPRSGGEELTAAPAAAPVEGEPQAVEPAAVSPPPISRQADPAVPRIEAAPAGKGQQEPRVGQESDRRRVRVQLTPEEQAPPEAGASPPRVPATPATVQASPAKVQESPAKVQASPAKVQASPAKVQASPTTVQAEAVERRVLPVARGDNGPVRVQAKSSSAGKVAVGSDADSRPRFSPMPLGPGAGAAPISRLADGVRATTQPPIPGMGVGPEQVGVRAFRPSSAEAEALPLHVPAAVQRTDEQRSTTTSQVRSLPTIEQSLPTEEQAPQEVDKDQLAREVYEVLKRRLIAEREQFWGY